MRSRYRAALSAVIGALCALGIAGLLLSARYQLESARQALSLERSLQGLASRLDAQLQQGAEAASRAASSDTGHVWHAWQWDGDATLSGQVDPLDEAALHRMLLSPASQLASPWRVDLLPTDQARDALVLARASGSGAERSWRGVWGDIDDLMTRAGVADFVHAGYRVRLYDPSQAAAWYQSEAGTWAAAATTPLLFAGERLELRAASREGALQALPMVTPSLLLVLAVVLWLSMLLRERQALRDARTELDETEQRRRHANELYGQALQSLADLETRLHVASLYDGSTGLANRSSLIHRLESALSAMRAEKLRDLYVIAVGFDSLGHITSSLGADFAERVIALAAERIAPCCPRAMPCTAAPISSWRWCCVRTAKPISPSDWRCVSPRPSKRPLHWMAARSLLHPSIGIAAAESAYQRAESLLDQASMAIAAVPHEAQCRHCPLQLRGGARVRGAAAARGGSGPGVRRGAVRARVRAVRAAPLPGRGGIRGADPLEPSHRGTPDAWPLRSAGSATGMAHRLNTWVMGEAARQAAAWRAAGYTQLSSTSI